MDQSAILTGSYNYSLIAVSFLIAILAAYAALELAGRVTATPTTLTVALASSQNPATYGGNIPVVFTATLPIDATGTATFLDGSRTVLRPPTIDTGYVPVGDPSDADVEKWVLP